MVARWPEPGLPILTRLPCEVGEGLDAGIGTRDDVEGLAVHGEDGAQILERALLLELRGAVIGVELPVGLGHAHVHVAGAHRVDVGDRPTGRRGRAADAVLRLAAIDEAADRLADDEVDAGLPAGADGDELLFLSVGKSPGAKDHGRGGHPTEDFCAFGVAPKLVLVNKDVRQL